MKKKLIIKIVIIVLFVLMILGCSKKCSTEPEVVEERWKRVESFGETAMTGIYLNSNKTRLVVTTTDEFGLILQDEVEPAIVTSLEIHIDENSLEYIPYFDDDYNFYCDEFGQIMYVGDNSNGELVGTVPITSLVDDIHLPAKFAPSNCMTMSQHIESNNNGLYMISIGQSSSYNNLRDDRLHFGRFETNDDSLSFIREMIIESYESLTSSEFIYSNFYYNNHFWQYRNAILEPPMTVVNESSYFTQYLTFYPSIRYAFDYNGYTIGVFDLPLKRSYDGGFTWEDWMMLNAGWDHVEIQERHVFFYSHNLASINFETMEIENYDRGELDGHSIIGMAEFGSKVFAATVDGLFYCNVEDFFVLKPESSRDSKDDFELNIISY
ncbi:MAG: hypothetical protein Q7J16_10500 [Candidatus Cloacimonadales bacterium]|nr:hypothetical protein [Candidatus Cloacimonadales bacterium]